MAKPSSDEKVLLFDGYLPIDPAQGIRQRAEQLIAERMWSTPNISYGDQSEPPEETENPSDWSITFDMGLDHIRETDQTWREDVAAIIAFLEAVQRETDAEFSVEVRFPSVPWYSIPVETIYGRDVDLDGLYTRILIASRCPPRVP